MNSDNWPNPVMWWSVPVINIERVGEHAAATWNEVNRRPPVESSARESMFGVCISDPKHPQSLNPRSSATMIRKLGLLGLVLFSEAIFLSGQKALC
jgi:hypothetical protein